MIRKRHRAESQGKASLGCADATGSILPVGRLKRHGITLENQKWKSYGWLI